MTRDEIYERWRRYMHRNDLDEDLNLVFDLATERIAERLHFDDPDLTAALNDHPSMWIHAGLTYLAELAQDQAQEMRENTLFLDALSDYSFRRSIKAGRRRQSIGSTRNSMHNPWHGKDQQWV